MSIRQTAVEYSAETDDPIVLLREGTRARHDALESSGWLDAVLRDLGTYGGHLARLAAFHGAAERALAPHRGAMTMLGFEPDTRRKSPLLADERAALRTVTHATGAGKPYEDSPSAAGAFPALRSLSDAVGAAYVLEGSTLGGVVIARAVRDRLGWDSAFYAGYGARTAERWRRFCGAVRAAGALLDPPALIRSANATFDTYATGVAPDR